MRLALAYDVRLDEATHRRFCGALQKDTAGLFCGACIRHHYWRILGHNLMMGWWGPMAFFLNPVYTIQNTIAYRSARKSLGESGLGPAPITLR